MARPTPKSALTALVLALAVAAAAGPAFLASRVDPPGNDMTLHGAMVAGAAEALREHGWTAFQDPWIDGDNGGYPLFHVYPHLAHQCTALPAALLGVDPWVALGAGALLAVLALPLGVWFGARLLGLEPFPAAIAAFVAATLRSADPFGHTTLAYGFDSSGMYAQLWGMLLAPVALGAWVSAARARSDGGFGPLARAALAALVVGAVLRTHLPTAWVLVMVAATTALAWGPAAQLPGRVLRFTAIGAAAVLLACGFLVPFLVDLDAVALSALEHAWKLESIGAPAVLARLVRGEYLDGVAHGPWTPALLAAIVVTVIRPRSVDPRLRALCVALVLSLLLLFGRETWGGWIDEIPLVGRFHDHRYLLGIHLVAPFIVALGGVEIMARVPARVARVKLPVAAGVLGLALVAHSMATAVDARAWRAARAPLGEMARALDPTFDTVRADGGRVAVVGHSTSASARRALAWAQRRGLETAGQTLHHYAPQRELALYWQGWIDDVEGFRARHVRAGDLGPLAVTALVVPPDIPGLAAGADLAVHPLGGGWRVVRPVEGIGGRTEVELVRSDLLVRARRLDLQGFAIGWFAAGLPDVAQHPSVDAGVGEPLDPGGYARVIDLAAADPGLLTGLPGAAPGALGSVLESAAGSRCAENRCRVQVEGQGAWVLRPRAWHPGWRATVDGAPAAVTLLAPGVIGVEVPMGSHDVVTWWHVPAWRGWWAALNTLIHLVGVVWLCSYALRRRLRRSA